jgi:hypothetical protein
MGKCLTLTNKSSNVNSYKILVVEMIICSFVLSVVASELSISETALWTHEKNADPAVTE